MESAQAPPLGSRYAVVIGRTYDIHPDDERFLMMKPAETTEGGLGNPVIVARNWFEELERLVPTG